MAKSNAYSNFFPKEIPLKWIDGEWFRLTSDLTYLDKPMRKKFLNVSERTIIAPKHMYTDFASFPELPTGGDIFKPTDIWAPAAVIHDALYKNEALYQGKMIKRAEADAIFRRAMKNCGVSYAMRWLMWTGVRIGGRKAWRRNHKK